MFWTIKNALNVLCVICPWIWGYYFTTGYQYGQHHPHNNRQFIFSGYARAHPCVLETCFLTEGRRRVSVLLLYLKKTTLFLQILLASLTPPLRLSTKLCLFVCLTIKRHLCVLSVKNLVLENQSVVSVVCVHHCDVLHHVMAWKQRQRTRGATVTCEIFRIHSNVVLQKQTNKIK